jgi:hypothetical protein
MAVTLLIAQECGGPPGLVIWANVKLAGGTTVVADDAFLAESFLPEGKVDGFSPRSCRPMPN